nr:hypothetical protein [Fibrella aquatilis]
MGTFRSGRRTGPGTLYDADGEVTEKGNYLNDALQ